MLHNSWCSSQGNERGVTGPSSGRVQRVWRGVVSECSRQDRVLTCFTWPWAFETAQSNVVPKQHAAAPA